MNLLTAPLLALLLLPSVASSSASQHDELRPMTKHTKSWSLVFLLAWTIFHSGLTLAQQHGEENRLIDHPADMSHASCLKVTELTPNMSPVDIYPFATKCAENGNYPGAANLMAAATTFAGYDFLRVPDRSAHQAILILQRNFLEVLSFEQKNDVWKELQKIMTKGTTELRSFCKDIRRVGPPTYYPSYMVEHGMGAFNGEDSNDKALELDRDKTWNKLLIEQLSCESQS